VPRSTGTHELLLDALGMYWIVLSELLGERGFEVSLVDSRQLKNAPGCKTGVLDGQWIQQLHTSGLSGAPSGPMMKSAFCAAIWVSA
jgi:transposase